ncbi:hypothetical protein IV203_027160 [Nitzschia inconspicua]|uniref:Uncharacterized protein n=1 Tax=Nitzschia inconspicua TaxID=303405 RepID=A0A9K3LJZ6_9STRA|nr:hypothetical protein IV203_027160 [Nitzschia inconspicua]
MSDTNINNDSNDNVQVILPLEDFAEDLEKRLGRANGNIYHRRSGIPGVHDGQVMVRLKKKRFIVIDYSIVPNEADYHYAAMSPYIRCPEGAGTAICSVSDCNKVGVPVLLYDSEPHEPQSLYLRSGLCFTCQRNLNEKRRTQRKKPIVDKDGNIILPPPSSSSSSKKQRANNSGTTAAVSTASGYASALVDSAPLVPYHQVLMAVTSGNKRIKLAHTNEPLTLAQDAIILNGPPDPTCKSAHTGHGFSEIGIDLARIAKESLESTQALVHAVDPSSNSNVQQQHHDHHSHFPPTSEDIARLYETSFAGLCKSLYLLTQWKESWDAAMAAAIHAQQMVIPPPSAASMDLTHHHAHQLANAIPDIPHDHHPHHLHHHHLQHHDSLSPTPGQSYENLHASFPGLASTHHHHHHDPDDPAGLAEAVASAAAVAAVGGDPSGQQQQHHHHHHDGVDTSKADADLMAAAAAAAEASGSNDDDGQDDASGDVIEL